MTVEVSVVGQERYILELMFVDGASGVAVHLRDENTPREEMNGRFDRDEIVKMARAIVTLDEGGDL